MIARDVWREAFKIGLKKFAKSTWHTTGEAPRRFTEKENDHENVTRAANFADEAVKALRKREAEHFFEETSSYRGKSA